MSRAHSAISTAPPFEIMAFSAYSSNLSDPDFPLDALFRSKALRRDPEDLKRPKMDRAPNVKTRSA